ncbi:ankyrin repeat-containing domain protein [Flagelloscypha sp. PMI_526]|nr:ankyrin repeat-containing domain protein [Flagelloscypha sp. PMI_526]
MRVVLNERAAGQFRMVACQLEVLHKTETTSDLEARLITLPKKLTDTYLYILDHLIPEDERVRAQMLLRILTVAFEAVSLNELAALIAVDLGDPADVINLPKYKAHQQFHQPQNIVGLGNAFVRLTYNSESQPFLQLSHASVKEYLLQQDPIHWCYMDDELAHSTMARACLALLLHNESSQPDAPIGEYVRQRWFQHVKSNSSNQLLTQQMTFFEKFPWSQESQFLLDEYPYFYFGISKELVYRNPLIAASGAGLYEPLQSILATKQPQDDLDQALRVAVIRAVGMDVIELLVGKGADVNKQVENFASILQAAALVGTLDMIKFFVEKGADVNKEGEPYGSSLHAAAERGRLDVVEFLIEKGANINGEGGQHGSALQAAARRGHLDVVEFLVEKGADMNKGGVIHRSALEAAACGGSLDIVELLVEKGADVNDGGYGFALQGAASRGSLDVVEFLVKKGADVNGKGGYGSSVQAAALEGHLKVVVLLVEKGADVNKEGGQFGFPLQAAAWRGALGVVEYLVGRGVDVNEGGGQHGSALQAAAWMGNLDVVEFLVEKGADVNKEGGQDGSALQAAASMGKLEVVEFLVEAGADVNQAGGKYGSALEAAEHRKQAGVVEFLKTRA